ncbi:MAG: hypothetical protein HRT53_05625 [Colwellia sp.]|nr:hypothetical protein [Colwellia sp.]
MSVFINSLLQFKPAVVAETLACFSVNYAIAIFGLFNVAIPRVR